MFTEKGNLILPQLKKKVGEKKKDGESTGTKIKAWVSTF